MILSGLIAFLVIAASVCLVYLIFRSENIAEKLKAFYSILTPVVYGIVIAYLLTPIVNYIERRILIPLMTRNGAALTTKKKKYMRMISVVLAIVIVCLFCYAFISVIVPEVMQSIITISEQFPYYIANITAFINKLLEDNPELNRLFLQFVDNYSDELNDYLNNTIIPQTQTILKHISLSLISLLVTLWNFIIGAIISVYVLFNKELFAGQAKKIIYAFMSTSRANTFIQDVRFSSETFIGFLSGKIVDSTIIGILCFIGVWKLNMPYALLISVIVGVTNVIPFFGPYLGAVPSALLILMVDPLKCLYFVIFIFILQQLDGNVIGPKILGQSTGLSGFWVIFAITLFGGLWGIVGMIVGVPLWAVIYALFKRNVGYRLKKKGLPEATGEYLRVERIENNEFILLQNDKKQQESKNRKTFSFFGRQVQKNDVAATDSTDAKQPEPSADISSNTAGTTSNKSSDTNAEINSFPKSGNNE